MGSARAPAAAGLSTGIAFVAAFSLLAAAPVCGVQFTQFETRFWVGFSEIIVWGTIVDAELKRVYSGGGFHVETVVTIYADKYLVDRTGQHSKFVTFRDNPTSIGCPIISSSEEEMLHDERRGKGIYAEYTRGERSLFFIENFDGDLHVTGFLGEFYVVDGDKVQSKQREMSGHEPFLISDFESEILRLAADKEREDG